MRAGTLGLWGKSTTSKLAVMAQPVSIHQVEAKLDAGKSKSSGTSNVVIGPDDKTPPFAVHTETDWNTFLANPNTKLPPYQPPQLVPGYLSVGKYCCLNVLTFRAPNFIPCCCIPPLLRSCIAGTGSPSQYGPCHLSP